MKSIIYIFVLIAYNCFCQKNNGTIILEKQVYLTYVDEFNNVSWLKGDTYKNLIFVDDNKTRMLYFLDEKSAKLRVFIKFPNDTILIKVNSSNEVNIESKKNPKTLVLTELLEKEKLSILDKHEGNRINFSEDYALALYNMNQNYNSRIKILNTFKNQISVEQYKIFQEIFELLKLNFLLVPYSPCYSKPGITPTEPEKVFKQIENGISLINSYDSTKISIYGYLLKDIIPNYLNFLTRETPEHIKPIAKLNFAIKNLKGEALNLGLTNVMLEKSENITFYMNNIKLFSKYCKNQKYLNKVIHSTDKLNLVKTDSTLLNTRLESFSGEIVTWGEIIKLNMNKVVYIDFWASWCAGCKLNINKINFFQDKYRDNLQVIYISKDIDKYKWKNSIKSWQFPVGSKHFLINPNTILSKLLTEPFIPKGTLIDKNGLIVSISAESPSSVLFEKKMIKLLK